MKSRKFVKSKFKIYSLSLVILSIMVLSTPVVSAQTDTGPKDCQHLEDQFLAASGGQQLATNPGDVVTTFPKYCTAAAVIDKAMTIIFSLSGAAAVLFIVIGGFMFMTSAGNQEQAEKGRKTLIYAIAGLVIIVLASAIVKVVVNLLVS